MLDNYSMYTTCMRGPATGTPGEEGAGSRRIVLLHNLHISYTHTHICTYTHIRIYAYTHIHIYAYTHIHMCI